MSHETIGRRYALAVFEIGKETGTLEPLAREMAAYAETYAGSQELADALDNPLIPLDKRETILIEIASRLGLGETAKRAVRVLFQNRRLPVLPELARQLMGFVDDERGVVRAHVTSAASLSESYLARLKAELERSTGKKVIVTSAEDASLIAGVVTRIGDQVIDGSVRARLAKLREQISPQGLA